MIIALLVAAIGGLLMGSFLNSAIQELASSDRNFYEGSTLNLAEAGVDVGFLAINEEDWDDWTVRRSNAFRRLPEIDLGNGSSGLVSITVADKDDMPTITSTARVTLKSGDVLVNQVKVAVKPRSFFANGVSAPGIVEFTGDGLVKVDSYDSSAGEYDEYFNRKDGGTLGSNQFTAERGSSVEVYGLLAKGEGRSTLGRGSKVYGQDTPDGVDIDRTRVTNDFTADLESITAPTVRRATDIGDRDTALGSGRSDSEYRIEGDLSIGENQTITITGKVALVVEGSLNIEGELNVDERFGSLELYVSGDLTVQGGGRLVNESKNPESLMIYSTAGEDVRGVDYDIANSVDTYAAIYAPKATVVLSAPSEEEQVETVETPALSTLSYVAAAAAPGQSGAAPGQSGDAPGQSGDEPGQSGDAPGRTDADASSSSDSGGATFSGAIVSHSVKFVGDFDFHFDEALKTTEAVETTFTIASWENTSWVE